MDTPLVSVIVPAFNAASYLQNALDSVLQQTYSNWELILVDDASQDNTLEIAYHNQKRDSRIKVLAMAENQGVGVARNLATDKAQGVLIAFLDADDLWLPQKLERQVGFMQTNDLAVSYTAYQQIYASGQRNSICVYVFDRLTERLQRSNNYIGNLTGMYSVEKVGKIKSPELAKRQDWALWHQAIKRSCQSAMGINEVLASYRVGNTKTLSYKKGGLIKHNYNFYRRYLGYNAVWSSLWMLVFFWHFFVVRTQKIKISK